MMVVLCVILAVLASLGVHPALAAGIDVDAAGHPPSLLWGIPFAGLLLSIAIFPLLAPRLWHSRMGMVAALWAIGLLIPSVILLGIGEAVTETWHAILIEYLPFMTVLLALFTAGGGILIEGGPWGSPLGNTLLLAVGTALAGLMGTTGVAMVLIHPLLRANAHRSKRVHLVIFFMVLCANAGGATSPLGDPPLYIGFLRGVPFGWPLVNLIGPLLVLAGILLVVFFVLDTWLARGDSRPPPSKPLRIRGGWNMLLIAAVVGSVLMQGLWHPGEITLLGQAIPIERLAGMAIFLAATAISLRITPQAVRQGNLFTWDPMAEVGKLFLAIFITIGPVLAMLAAGRDGPLAGLIGLTTNAAGEPQALAYFWLTGVLSAFLDNAPTYLVFFQLAGDDPALLTGRLGHVLQALSAGAVFFGALTYIGNAPNMMVRSIAAHRGIRMPSFFVYIAWVSLLLIPVFVLLTWLFFI